MMCQSDRYKENLANFKKQYSDLVSRSRTTLNTNATEIKALTAERDSLKAQLESKPPPTEQSNTLTTRIEVLVAEKVQLETSFAEEKTRLEGIIENERAKAAAATATVVSTAIINTKYPFLSFSMSNRPAYHSERTIPRSQIHQQMKIMRL